MPTVSQGAPVGAATPPHRVVIVTPAPRHSRLGNRTTALRWAGLLRSLGCRVRIVDTYRGEPCDLLVAIHAAKSATSVAAVRAMHPTAPVVVLCAGTDIYPTFEPTAAAAAALTTADRLLVLQPLALDLLPPAWRAKARVLRQSAVMPHTRRPAPPPFRLALLAHLRAVKDPLLPFAALAGLPGSPFTLTVAGRALDPAMAAAVTAATAQDPRTAWVGELPRRTARQLLADSHLCLVPSTAEGGANVLSESIAAGTPVLASDVPGNRGLLGDDWPGLFPPGDPAALADLLRRYAAAPDYRANLNARTAALARAFHPDLERAGWRALLGELLACVCHGPP